jgi:restriction system protein
MSFFQIKTYSEEFLAALEGDQVTTPPVAEDEAVALVAEEIEETTQDFILKRLAQELKGHPLEQFVAHLLNALGYRTRVSPDGADGGVDIVAHKDELGFEPPIIKVQVKSTAGSVGDPVASALYGKVAHEEFGLASDRWSIFRRLRFGLCFDLSALSGAANGAGTVLMV